MLIPSFHIFQVDSEMSSGGQGEVRQTEVGRSCQDGIAWQ